MGRPRTRVLLLPAVLASAAFLGAAASNGAGALTISSHARIPLSGTSLHTNAGWSSSNWSGYAISGGTGAFHAITGQWTVTAVSATSGSTYSSSWIGIDGYNNSNLIQTGTEADYYGGSAHYAAWWEILPAPETVISGITVHPGDHMSAKITKGSGVTWTITLKDVTTGKSFTTSQTYAGPQSSAEWIEEAPTVNGNQANVAHYGTLKFDPGTVNGANPHLTASEGGVMVQHNRQVSTPSNPDSDTDGFNCRYGATKPSPPSS
jgi:hypothetical protein